MGRMTIDMYGTPISLKRGDILQQIVRGKTYRTWFVLGAKQLKPTRGVPRFNVWRERWWDLEPHLRIKLYQSAERNGGQVCIDVAAYPPKKKPTFEQLMGAK